MNGSSPHTLHLRISPLGLTFAHYEPETGFAFRFQTHVVAPTTSLAINVRNILSKEPLAQQTYKRVHVSVHTPYTLVPLNDFIEEDCHTIYQYNMADSEQKKVFYDTIPSQNTVLLFGLHENVCRQVEEHFGTVLYSNTMTSVLTHFAEKGRCGMGRRLYAYLHDKEMDVTAFDGGRLLLANTFPICSEADATYYLLFIFKQVGWNAVEDEIYLAGDTSIRNRLAPELHRYVQQVCPITPSAEYNRHPVTQQEGIPYDMITKLLQTF